MFHHSLKSDGSCILNDSSKSCQGGFWVKFLLVFIFSTIFLKTPSIVSAQTSDCRREGRSGAAGQCDSQCNAFCPTGYSPCEWSCSYNYIHAPYNYCTIPDMVCLGMGKSSGLCCCPTTPTPTPPLKLSVKSICSKVTGYVKNKTTGKGIYGAKVTAHGIDNSVANCQGKHYSCGTVTTNSNGYFEISCKNVSDANTKCLGVYETNKTGFIDAYGAYGPLGSHVWSNNTIMLNNPQTSTCGTFNFWDKK